MSKEKQGYVICSDCLNNTAYKETVLIVRSAGYYTSVCLKCQKANKHILAPVKKSKTAKDESALCED